MYTVVVRQKKESQVGWRRAGGEVTGSGKGKSGGGRGSKEVYCGKMWCPKPVVLPKPNYAYLTNPRQLSMNSYHANESWLHSKGFRIWYTLLVVAGHLVLLAVPIFSTRTAWTLTNVLHSLVLIKKDV